MHKESWIKKEDLLNGHVYVGYSPLINTEFIIFYTGDLTKATFIKDSKFYKNRACCTASYVKFRPATQTEISYIKNCMKNKLKCNARTEKYYEEKDDSIINDYTLI